MPDVIDSAAATAAPSDPASIFEDAIASIEPPADEPSEEPQEAGTEEPAEAPAPAAAPSPAPPEAEDDFTVSHTRPWTPERAAKAHEKQLTRERELDGLFIRARRKDEKAGRRLQEVRAETERNDLIAKQLAAAAAGLRGNGREVLDALGRLTGRNGTEVYEEMSLSIAGARKADPRDSVIAELKATVDKLAAKLDTDEQQRTQSAQAAEIRRDIKSVVGNAEEWPTIAALSGPDTDSAAADFEDLYVAHCRQVGSWVDVQSFADRLERTLRKKGAPATPESDQGSRASSAKPVVAAQRAPQLTLSPSLVAESGGSRRELSEDERTAELARDPDFLRDIFGHSF